MAKFVTLKDIAKETGLTMASVSRAMNDTPDVSEETKRHVWEVATKLGYRPNVFASSLRTGKSRFIGVIIPQNTNPYFASILSDIMEVVIARGFLPLMFNTVESRKLEAKAVSAMLSFRVAGILTIPVDLKNYANLPIPVVVMARVFEKVELDQFDYIINDERGMEISVSHLAAHYNRIYYISGSRGQRSAEVRREAFETAIRRQGLEYTDDLVRYCESSNTGSGYDAAKQLIEEVQPPYAIQCMSDHFAIGVMQAIRESNLRMPEDISVVGYDNIAYCEYLPVPLSSIRLSHEIGKVAASFLFKKLENNEERMKIIVEPKLVVRKSSYWPED